MSDTEITQPEITGAYYYEEDGVNPIDPAEAAATAVIGLVVASAMSVAERANNGLIRAKEWLGKAATKFNRGDN